MTSKLFLSVISDYMIKNCVSIMQDNMRWLKDQTFVRDVKF